MKKRLLDALPIASIICATLIFLAPNVLLAQESRSGDSLKVSTKERDDRGRRSSRDVKSRRSRDASQSAPTARPSDEPARTRSSTRAREARTGRTETRNDDGRRPTTGRDGRRQDAGAGVRDGRDGNSGRGSGERTNDDRRGDRENGRLGDRDNDRRGDRDYNRRGDRDYNRRGDRYDRDQVIINRHPQGHHWGRPRVIIDVNWPWVHRHQRRWSPRYRYRQVVYVDVGWGRNRRESRLDLRTFYRHRVRDASPRRAVVDIEIDRIEIYEDGFFVGEVRTIPDDLARMRAVVDRRRGVSFDRNVFLLGDPYVGFEMISTRHYDGFVLNKYRRSHGVRAGEVDLRRERVVPLRRSRFFDPRNFSGFVPINLLPEDAGWLIDYGYDSYSGHYWGDDDRYYYGFSDLDDYVRFGGDRANDSQTEPRGTTSGREHQSSRVTPERQALERSVDRTFDTDAGAKIRLKRDSSIERVD